MSESTVQALAQRLEIENLRQDVIGHGIVAIGKATIPMAAVVTIFVPASKALAEVVVVIASVYVIAAVPEVGVSIGVRISIIAAPMVVPVRLAGAKAFLVAVVHRLPQHLRAVFVGLVAAPAAMIAIDRGRIEIGVAIIVESMIP